MDLKDRQIRILEILLREERPCVVQELAEILQVSIRTVRYDVKEMNYWLDKVGAEIQSKPKVGIWLENKEAARQLIQGQAEQEYRNYSSKARKLLAVVALFDEKGFVTTENLAETLSVSRSTILATLKELKADVETGPLKLISRARYGYRLEGPEEVQREFAAGFLADSLKDQTFGEVRSNLPFDDVESLFREIRKRISLSKKENGIWIPQEQFQMVASYIFLSIQSMKKNRYLMKSKEKYLESGQPLFQMAKGIYAGLSAWLDIEIPVREIETLNHVLLKNHCKVFELKGRRVFDPKLIDAVYEMLQNCKLRFDPG